MSTVLRKKMHQDLQLAGLSEGTQGLHLRVLRQLAVHYDTPPDRLSEQQVRDFLLHLKNDKKSASSTLGIAYSGHQILLLPHRAPRSPTLQRIRVQKEKRLPDVLTIDEVRQLIGSSANSASGPISQRCTHWACGTTKVSTYRFATLTCTDAGARPSWQGRQDRFVPLPAGTLPCSANTG